MSDSNALRRKILAMACLPLVAAPMACDKKGPPDEANTQEPITRNSSLTETAASTGAASSANNVEEPSSQPASTGTTTADKKPPFPDPVVTKSEANRTEYKWCASATSAQAHIPNDKTPLAGGLCPQTLRGNVFRKKAKALGVPGSRPGVNFVPLRFDEAATNKERTARKQEDLCCYQGLVTRSKRPHGRPFLLEQGGQQVAELRQNDPSWLEDEPGDALRDEIEEALRDEIEETLRAELAQAWLDDALEEHASVASFARATLELMYLGAPSELLEGLQRAALEEVEHARGCFALASRFQGAPIGPGALPVEGPRQDLAQIARDTLLGGCIGESVAALIAERASRRATDPQIKQLLTRIADEEASHASLAFSCLAWMLRLEQGEALRAMLREEIALLGPTTHESEEREDLERWHAFGRLSESEEIAAEQDAWRDVIGPLLQELELA